MTTEILPSYSVRLRDTRVEADRRAVLARHVARYDAILVERFNTGDDKAFDEIIERYRAKIYAFAFTLLRNHADAEEVAQDTLIRAHRALGRFRGICSLATWLYTIARNLARNRYWHHFRRRRHTTQSLDCAISEDCPSVFADVAASNGPGAPQEAITSEFLAMVVDCIAKLSPVHRNILDRRVLQNESYDEIAVSLRVNVGTVKSRIARAREKLRELMVAACPEFEADAEPREWFETFRTASPWLAGAG